MGEAKSGRGKGKGRYGGLGWVVLLSGVLLLLVWAALVAGRRAAAQIVPAIVINEIQYNPRSGDAGEEYIELYNAGSTPVDLSGWAFVDGIVYTFTAGTVISPGGYLVVGHDPATVEATYGISDVLGPFASGKLSNGGERVALADSLGTLVDEVSYDDHHPWPEEPDGNGPSLELINPAFDNDRPCSWAASSGLGTPGAQNSAYASGNVPPCVTDVAHAPTFPTSGQGVTVTALVDDNRAVTTVTLHYRPQGETAYTTLTMVDDGSGADAQANDGLYTALIPPQPAGRYVEFYVTATDDEGATQTVPEGAPGGTSGETGLPVTVSYLYLVEDTPPSSDLPLYRLLMTDENRTELARRDLYSNVLLDATFVYQGTVYYNVGVRYRGESTRDVWPRPYRIKFRDAQEFESRERLNLVSDNLGREAMTYGLFHQLGLPASNVRFVTLYINGHWEGDYLDIEEVDNDFLRAHFPGDDTGNLYRGQDGADLSYRGTDPNSYRPYYLKRNNEAADDYTDVISLTYALTNAPDEQFQAQAEAVADMRQWLRWFALQAVLDNHEGALWVGQGDDYFLYHRPSDDRFILISWDHDTTFMYADHSIWESNLPVVQRILHHPTFARWYYQEIAQVLEMAFTTEALYPQVDALPAVVGDEERQAIKSFIAARIPSLWAQIPDTSLSITTNGGADFVTTVPTVTLEGTCSPLRDLSINGSTTGIEYPTPTTWRYTATLWTRDNRFVISDGLESRAITVYWDYFQGGTLTQDTRLWTSARPYVINQDILVPAGVTLTIEPGVTLQFGADRVLRVEGGRLLAEGTAEQPIYFTRQGAGYWGGILLYNSPADNRIRHAVIEYTREVIAAPRTHGVSAYNSRITIADSIIRHTQDSNAVIADYGSTLYLLRNEIYDIESDPVHATGGYAYIQGNVIHDAMRGFPPPDGIELSDMVTPAVVLDNEVYNILDDCLDLNHASAVIERNELHDCGNKGISIGWPSTTTLVNNLIYATEIGVAVKDSAVSRLVNNTLADNQYGLWLYEDHTGEGAGLATVVNSILWGNQVRDIELDLAHGAAITVTYSIVQEARPGEGNLTDDPLFQAPASGVYRLREDSPAVDSATPEGAPAEDIWGVPRPQGGGYDRGAHEFFEFYTVHLPLVLR